MSTYDLVADLPLTIDDYALERPSRTGVERLRARHDGHPHPRRRRGGRRRGRHLRRRRAARASRSSARSSPLAGEWTFDGFSEHLGDARPVPGAARRAGRVPQLPPLGRSRARRSTSRCARPAARSPTLLGREPEPVRFVVSSADGRAADDRAGHAPPRPLPGPALQARRHAGLGRRADRRRSSSTGAVDSIDFKGAYNGTPVDAETDPALLPAHRRGVPGRLARGPRPRDPRGARGAAPVRGPDHLGRADPLGRRHPRAAGAAADGQPQAVALRLACAALFDGYDFCAERGMGAYGGGQFELGVGPRPDPVPGRAVPRRRAERHRAVRL